MRSRPVTKTIDFAGILLTIGVILLMVGSIPFTPVSVGILLLLAKTELSLSWT